MKSYPSYTPKESVIMVKKMDLSKFKDKIAHPSKKLGEDRFEIADRVLGITEAEKREKVVPKSIAISKEDIKRLKELEKRFYGLKRAPSDSHIIRAALLVLSNSSDEIILKACDEVPQVQTGRPRKKR